MSSKDKVDLDKFDLDEEKKESLKKGAGDELAHKFFDEFFRYSEEINKLSSASLKRVARTIALHPYENTGILQNIIRAINLRDPTLNLTVPDLKLSPGEQKLADVGINMKYLFMELMTYAHEFENPTEEEKNDEEN